MFWAANGGDFIENKTIEKSASADREYRFFFLKRRNEKTGQGYCPVFLLCLRYKIKRSYNLHRRKSIERRVVFTLQNQAQLQRFGSKKSAYCRCVYATK